MNKFTHYWRKLSSDEKAALALDADTSKNHISQCINGHRGFGANLIRRLIKARGEIVWDWFEPDSQEQQKAL